MLSPAELPVLSRVDLAYMALSILTVAIGLVSVIVTVTGRTRTAVGAAFGVYSLLYGSRLLFSREVFQIAVGMSPHAGQQVAAVLNYLAPIAGTYLWTHFVGPRSRKVLFGFLAVHSVMALVGITSDFWTGRPMSQQAIHNPLVIASIFATLVVLWVNIRGGFLRFDWAIRSAVAGSGLLLAGIVYDKLMGLGWLRSIPTEPVGFIAFLCGMGMAVRHRISAAENRLMMLRAEVEQARQIQRSILPEAPPSDTPFRIAASYSPMTTVAGDLYDFIPLGDGRLTVFIADVSGHGMPAALVSSMLKTALTIYGRHCASPGALLIELNRVFFGQFQGQFQGQFVTAACAVLDPSNQTLTYSAAGHPPLLLWSRSGSDVRQVERNGLPIGIAEFADYSDVTVPFASGDRIAMYTDGIVEAENAATDQFGAERLGKILSQPGADADSLLRNVLTAVREWCGNPQEQSDDLTLIIVEYALAQEAVAAVGDAGRSDFPIQRM